MLLGPLGFPRRTWLPAFVLAVVMTGCGSSTGSPSAPVSPSAAAPSAQQAPGGPGVGPVPATTPVAEPPDADFPKPHPRFAEHFADPIYHDQGDEFAPFGSDEGFDTLYTWQEHPEDLTGCTTVRSMFDAEDGSLTDAMEHAADRDDPAADGAVVGVGFTLLLFTGHIDPEGKRLVMDAVLREARYYDDESLREFPVLLRDLASFPATSC